MSILDSVAALLRARRQIGQPDGAGRCLENVYNWFGAVPSIGPGRGHYSIALAGWQFAIGKTYPIELAPAGVPVWFDVSPTRTDKNRAAGDVGLSIGSGYGIFTDSPTGNTGIMSFVDRGLQIARPPLGFTTDFLGHDTTAGLAWLQKPAGKPVIVTTQNQENPMSDVHIHRDALSNALVVQNNVTGLRRKVDDGDAADLGALVNNTARLPFVRIDQLNEKYLRPVGILGALDQAVQPGRPLAFLKGGE